MTRRYVRICRERRGGRCTHCHTERSEGSAIIGFEDGGLLSAILTCLRGLFCFLPAWRRAIIALLPFFLFEWLACLSNYWKISQPLRPRRPRVKSSLGKVNLRARGQSWKKSSPRENII